MLIDRAKTWIIFGLGQRGKDYCEYLLKKNITISEIWDNNKKLFGTYRNIMVCAPHRLDDDETKILITVMEDEQVFYQLTNELDIDDERIIRSSSLGGLTGEGIRTSASDDILYRDMCMRAVNDDRVFSTFREASIYKRILEHVSVEQANEYLAAIFENSLLINDDLFCEFRRNDDVGGAKKYKFIINGREYQFAPTTIRYIKVLSDIMSLFNFKDFERVSEIGVGYGGQARVLSCVNDKLEYVLIDLREPLALAKKYLDCFGGINASFEDGTLLDHDINSDLVISNYAFSELSRSVQELYFDRVIKHAKSGYMTMNRISERKYNGFSPDELLDMIPNSGLVEEKPLTAEGNYIIVWGKKG